jgi:hypothetical protein
MFVARCLLGAAFGATLVAQNAPSPDALTAATTRLQKSLAAMLQLDNCAFKSSWGPDVKPDKDKEAGNDQVGIWLANGAGGSSEASGAWDHSLLRCKLGDDEVLTGNRRTLARENNGAWKLRRDKRADGSPLGFVPDPQQLLQLLAAQHLAVTHREVGTVDDKPVEFLTVTLDADQVAETIWSGLLPEGSSMFGAGMAGVVIFRAQVAQVAGGAGGVAAAKPAMPKPEATIDLAFAVDPATGLVHRIELRSWQKNDANGMARVVQRGGGIVVAGRNAGNAGNDDDEDSDEDAKKAKAAAAAPMVYENGLPQRPRKKMSVDGFGITFADHGKAEVAVDDAAKALLLLK